MTTEIPLPNYFTALNKLSSAFPRITFSRNLIEQITSYSKVYKLTTQLLYGDDGLAKFRSVMQPDPRKLKPKLDQLTKKTGFNCVELSQIITTIPKTSTLIAGKKGAHKGTDPNILEAVMAIEHAVLPQVMKMGNEQVIYDAVQNGNIKFFIKLGRFLDNRNRHHNPIHLDRLRLLLYTYWPPGPTWPGLAYCENLVRMNFCKAALSNCPERGNFDQIWRRMGLKTAQIPFITHSELLNGVLYLS